MFALPSHILTHKDLASLLLLAGMVASVEAPSEGQSRAQWGIATVSLCSTFTAADAMDLLYGASALLLIILWCAPSDSEHRLARIHHQPQKQPSALADTVNEHVILYRLKVVRHWCHPGSGGQGPDLGRVLELRQVSASHMPGTTAMKCYAWAAQQAESRSGKAGHHAAAHQSRVAHLHPAWLNRTLWR